MRYFFPRTHLLINLSERMTLPVAISSLHPREGKSNVAYPMRFRVNKLIHCWQAWDVIPQQVKDLCYCKMGFSSLISIYLLCCLTPRSAMQAYGLWQNMSQCPATIAASCSVVLATKDKDSLAACSAAVTKFRSASCRRIANPMTYSRCGEFSRDSLMRGTGRLFMKHRQFSVLWIPVHLSFRPRDSSPSTFRLNDTLSYEHSAQPFIHSQNRSAQPRH